MQREPRPRELALFSSDWVVVLIQNPLETFISPRACHGEDNQAGVPLPKTGMFIKLAKHSEVAEENQFEGRSATRKLIPIISESNEKIRPSATLTRSAPEFTFDKN